MATTKAMVDEYRVYYSTPKKAKRLKYSATIELFYSNSIVGTLRFYADGTTVPSDALYIRSRGYIIYLNFHESQYQNILDILRNEKPVYVSIVAKYGSPGDYEYGEGDIRTGDEPVGEEEGT